MGEKQHYVPQTYLKYFGSDYFLSREFGVKTAKNADPITCSRYKNGRKAGEFQSIPKNVCGPNDFYKIKSEKARYFGKDCVDKKMKRYEDGNWRDLIKDICSARKSGSISAGRLSYLYEWVFHLFIRSKKFKNDEKTHKKLRHRIILNNLVFLDSLEYTLLTSTDLREVWLGWVASMTHPQLSKSIFGSFVEHLWGSRIELIFNQTDVPFKTSDYGMNPITVSNDIMCNPNYFPVTSRIALFVDQRGDRFIDAHYVNTRKSVKNINMAYMKSLLYISRNSNCDLYILEPYLS